MALLRTPFSGNSINSAEMHTSPLKSQKRWIQPVSQLAEGQRGELFGHHKPLYYREKSSEKEGEDGREKRCEQSEIGDVQDKTLMEDIVSVHI